MYVIVESEIKLNLEGNLEYIDIDITTCNSIEEGITIIEQKKNEALEKGYFTKVVSETQNKVTLHNGGTYYKDYRLKKVGQ